MADFFTVIEPNTATIKAAFDSLPNEIRTRLAAKFKSLSHEMLGHVEADEPEKTGSLRSNTKAYSFLGKMSAGGGVAIYPEHGESFNLKAAALEYGSHESIKVAGHGMRLDHFMSKRIEPMNVFVDAYNRQTNIMALHFMQDALNAERSHFTAMVQEVIREVAGGFNGSEEP